MTNTKEISTSPKETVEPPKKGIEALFMRQKIEAGTKDQNRDPHSIFESLANLSKETIVSNEQITNRALQFVLLQEAEKAEAAQPIPNADKELQYKQETVKLTDQITQLAA